jgi:hypothetical protein
MQAFVLLSDTAHLGNDNVAFEQETCRILEPLAVDRFIIINNYRFFNIGLVQVVLRV